MNWLILSIFLTFNSAVLSNWMIHLEDDLAASEEPAFFVSLGSHCQTAVQLNYAHLRTRAFPFDWLLTFSHKHLIKLLHEDFNFFLDNAYLFRSPKNPRHIENNYYQIEFRHEWPFDDNHVDESRFKQMIYEAQIKYERRIARFRELRNFSGKVFFIRSASNLDQDNYWARTGDYIITAQKAIELRDALRHFFPSLDFTLVIVNYTSRNAPAITGLENILEFKVANTTTFAYNDFKPMFTHLKSISNLSHIGDQGDLRSVPTRHLKSWLKQAPLELLIMCEEEF